MIVLKVSDEAIYVSNNNLFPGDRVEVGYRTEEIIHENVVIGKEEIDGWTLKVVRVEGEYAVLTPCDFVWPHEQARRTLKPLSTNVRYGGER